MQIGSQLRDGKYGACFHQDEDGVYVLSARPRRRVWRAHATTASVLKTLNLSVQVSHFYYFYYMTFFVCALIYILIYFFFVN